MKSHEQFPQSSAEKPILQRAYEKSVEEMREGKIQINSFLDRDPRVIESDTAKIAQLREKFAENQTEADKEAKMAADILESIMHEQIELSDWMGPEAGTIECSDYDDYVNGVDMVVEFGDEAAMDHLALAIDVTFSSNPAVLKRKMSKIKRKIDKQELATIKYFRSEKQHFEGRLSMRPQVVIAVSRETLESLSQLWVAEDKKALGNHRVQYQILHEIVLQLKTYYAYAKDNGFERSAKAILKSLRRVEPIYNDKVAHAGGLSGGRDSVFKLMVEILTEFDSLPTEPAK